MATIPYSFRIDENTKRELDAVCFDIGMSTATAFSMFAKRMVAERGLPFRPMVITPQKKQVSVALREAQAQTKGYDVDEDEIMEFVARAGIDEAGHVAEFTKRAYNQ